MSNICQTLWTNKQSLLENNFGWSTPQHHIMGWALSALKLAKHYEKIHLYTDTNGKNVLIDDLGLPYTSIFTDYDNLECPPYLWAKPKLITYAIQDSPFLHVDGDVMIWRPIKTEIISAELIAQNMEKGSGYYQKFLTPLCKGLKYFPKLLRSNFEVDIKAYNAGILGGSDVKFFKRFVSEALEFIKNNEECRLDHNFNLIFEQLLFFSMAEKERKKVTCLKEKVYTDNGYSQQEFADFTNAHVKPLAYNLF